MTQSFADQARAMLTDVGFGGCDPGFNYLRTFPGTGSIGVQGCNQSTNVLRVTIYRNPSYLSVLRTDDFATLAQAVGIAITFMDALQKMKEGIND